MPKFSLSSLRSRAIILVLLAILPLLALTFYSYVEERNRAVAEVQRDETGRGQEPGHPAGNPDPEHPADFGDFDSIASGAAARPGGLQPSFLPSC